MALKSFGHAIEKRVMRPLFRRIKKLLRLSSSSNRIVALEERIERLDRRNAAAGERDLEAYRVVAGELLAEVHRHFHWYYREGVRLTIGGPRPGRAA